MTLIPVLLANAVKNTNGNTINGAFTTGRMKNWRSRPKTLFISKTVEIVS